MAADNKAKAGNKAKAVSGNKAKAVSESKAQAAPESNAASLSFNTIYLDSTGTFFFTYPTSMPSQAVLQELQKNFIKQKFGEDFSIKDPATALSYYKEQNKEIEILKDQISFPLPGILQFVTYYYASSQDKAHGENGSQVGIYALADGKKIDLKNIFVKGAEKNITQLIINEFLRMQNIQSLADYSYTQKESDFAPVSAMINDLGMDFVYPTYKLAPHAAGEQVVFLSWQTLKPYLNKQSAIYQKLKF